MEADQCYNFVAQKIDAGDAARAAGSNTVDDYPNPDLAIEIDISPSLIDRTAIYAAPKVTELWRLDGETVTIERLGPDSNYQAIPSSLWIPVRAAEVVRWLTLESASEESAWTRALRTWVREDVARRTSR